MFPFDHTFIPAYVLKPLRRAHITPTEVSNMSSEPVMQLEPIVASEKAPKTVLIVDDDESQVAALDHRLRRLGFSVVSTGLGEEALRLVLDRRPDAVLLDLRLPDIEGFEVCERLADDPCTCGIPVIILSALERPDIVRHSRSVGCDYYLRKPYDPNVLLTLLERALEGVPSDERERWA
jgi:CheY-like chemotaxis protein